MGVKARRLMRATLPSNLLSALPSPATPYSRRLAIQDSLPGKGDCSIYFASGAHIYKVKVNLCDETVLEGKEKLLIPTDAQILEATKLNHCPHRAEVHCISICSSTDGSVLLSSADAYGRLVVTHLKNNIGVESYSVSPSDDELGEGGWAGCAFAPHQFAMVAVARGLAKTIDLYDKDIHVRKLRTLQQPTAMTFLHGPCDSANSALLAVTEGPQVSIWDLRAGERSGCIQRIVGSFTGAPLYAVSSSTNQLIGTGGADRSVTVFDVYKWAARARWVGCLKYEVTGLSFSVVERDFLYVHGMDYEVVGGQWNASEGGSFKRSIAFRGDSRWLGIHKSTQQDMLAGWCESGSIFLSEFTSA